MKCFEAGYDCRSLLIPASAFKVPGHILEEPGKKKYLLLIHILRCPEPQPHRPSAPRTNIDWNGCLNISPPTHFLRRLARNPVAEPLI
jgi:hypothetical protein